MKERGLTVPEIIQIAGTRVALGAGVGLLLGSRLNNDQRKSAGLALLIVGVISTIPLAINIANKETTESRRESLEGRGNRLESVAG